MKKRIENIDSLIEGWCKKKLVFARPLLPFGSVREAHAHCTHLQNAQADAQTKICKRVQFLPSHNALLKVCALLIMSFSMLSNYAQESYITTVDLNLRGGAGQNYKTITVIAKGDTIKLLENSGNYWAKIQYQDKIGYSAKQYLQKIDLVEELKNETETESGNGFWVFIICLLIVIVTSIILKKAGEKYRYKSTATLLSFFFGAFGFQKFYLGEKNKGTYSILFCWTFIPSLVGLIDFIKYAVMNDTKFNDLYNWGKRPKQTTQKAPPKVNYEKVSSKAPVNQTHSNIDSEEYILGLFKSGLYLDEILNSVRNVKLKMPNGDDIIHTQQITSIIRNKIPNATFEIKNNNISKEKNNQPVENVEQTVKQKDKQTKPEEKDMNILNLARKSYPNDLEIQDHVYNEQVDSREFMLNALDKELIEFSKRKYPDDYSLQEYVYKEQAESKAFMDSKSNDESKIFAIKKYPDDYSLQAYVYKEQIESKAFMEKASNDELKTFAKEKYPDDYSLQEYIYKEQLKSKAFMKKVTDINIKKYVIAEYPNDYSMQEYIYNEQIALPENERERIEVDETIIDVNLQNLDLSVAKNIESNVSHHEPPYWSHSYVYSYDELRYANKEQKKFYFYLKNKVLAGEFVDIKGNTNYAFILYFDLLNEYQSHRDIKLLDEQFKLLAEICPKTRNYSFRSLQDELRKRNDSYSVDKLKDLEEPNYLFENAYTDYNPDLYKLGNQYKEKLGLTKQEINWLNKFYNPSNVFTSIEGCSLAVINIYLAVFNELNLQLKDIDSSIDNEMDKIFEKVCDIEKLKFNSYNAEYEKRWATGRFHESFFITFYKTIENLVREKYGHKRKLTFENYYPYSKSTQYIDEIIGNKIQSIIIEKIQGLNEPDLDTQIALNIQNVNRWKIEFDILTNDFKKEEQEKFIDAIITLEETNQKNPNIENIFYDASKFIAKYNNVQALKYYAKYIYYDLKSVKFDNKEFSKTIQKSLFKSEEQINDFKEIIAELIDKKDIQTALEKISKKYAPKRKKIQLDLSEIEEVEQKHEGTVELLNEYLKDERAKHETEIVNNSDDNTEISIVSTKENNSIFISEIRMGQVQEELVKMIINNSFEIHQAEVDKFATANGMFKNQLIDSINEACEEYLDGEALIEEEEENYSIEESYYKEIAK